MKPKNLFIKLTFFLLLVVSSLHLKAQNPYPNTGNHTVCVGVTEPYGVVLNAGSAYAWTVTPLAGGNGTITAGATPNLITINWTTVGTATLQVTETNSFGCVGDPVTIIVTILPTPVLVITNPPAVCAPGTVDLTAAAITAGSTPGLTLTYWTDAAATIPYPTPTTATAGTYYIKGTTAGGCFDIKAVVVTINPAPTVLITNPPSVCAPATVDLTAAAITAGSTLGLTFTYWTDAAGTIPYTTPATATAGTYYIKGTAGTGCFDIQPVVVTITASPTVVITNPAPICSPNTVDLTAAAVTAGSTPGLTLTYWTDAAATTPYTTPTVATAGTYYIKGTLAGGCFDIKPVTVTVNPLPTPLVTGPTPVCVSTAGATETYSTPNVAGHTYNWVVAGGTITAGQGTNTITVQWTTAGAGTVTVTQAITATGCSANHVLNVTVNPKPVTTPISHN
jgi:large repetitive protein